MRPDREIERELEGLGEKIQYPPTPDLARSVRRRLEETEARPARWAWIPTLPPRWAAAAAMLVLVLSIPVFSQAARDSLSGVFTQGEPASGGGEGGAESAAPQQYEVGDPGRAEEPVDTMAPTEDTGGPFPSSGSGAGSSGEAASVGENLGFGERISLRQAQERAGARILLPDLGKPDEVYVLQPPNESGVVLVYEARPGLPALGDTGVGLVLVQLPNGGESALLGGTGSGTRLEEVNVGDGPGYWASDGLPASAGATGQPGAGALVWSERDRALKLEAEVTKQEAVRIAGSVN